MNQPSAESTADAQQAGENFRSKVASLRDTVQTVFVGQDQLVNEVLSALCAGGHVLLEGVPGLGKTLLVRTIAQAVQLSFQRIQFTPDLMPGDITGTMVLRENEAGEHELRFEPGPLLANLVLADEINRATPKTQSALLEAMQEHQVSVGRESIPMPQPFMVLATQNPVEQEGTYPLPEAQLDRFLIKSLVRYPSEDEYLTIMNRTTGAAELEAQPILTQEDLLQLRTTARQVAISEQVTRYAIRIVMATQPNSPAASEIVNETVQLGASPRGIQALILMGKVHALLDGRFAVSCQDIRDVAMPTLRHRLLLSFDALTDGRQADDILAGILEQVSELSDG